MTDGIVAGWLCTSDGTWVPTNGGNLIEHRAVAQRPDLHVGVEVVDGLAIWTVNGQEHHSARVVDQIVEWQPRERVTVPGKGLVFIGPNPFRGSPSDAIGRRLNVDGAQFEVRGIEWTAGTNEVGLVVRAIG